MSESLVDLSKLEGLAEQFQGAEPFPHVAVTNFLTVPPERLAPHFPGPDWAGWTRFVDRYQHQKMFCADPTRIPGPLAAIISALGAPAFLQALQTLTGISGLIPDPYLDGGGLHSSGPGGTLSPHTDFHIYRRLALFRRVNVLLYLNPEWSDADGGCLELYAEGAATPSVTIVPRWGTCVIFETDARSVHGFTRPIRDGRWRNSIALYYYTSTETSRFSGDADTHWRTHAPTAGRARVGLAAYRALLAASAGLSRLAHRVNPHLASPRAARPEQR